MCYLFLVGTLIAAPIYLTVVIIMSPVTIYFDVHFYLSLLIIFYLLLFAYTIVQFF